MTTLAAMKARIAREVRRSNIGTQISEAIDTAIAAYADDRFYFNETRSVSFSTVAGQEFYSATDEESLGRVRKIDYAKLFIGDYPYHLTPETPERMEFLSQNGTQTGQPLTYCYYGRQFRLWPVPVESNTVRLGCVLDIPAPADDAEPNNPWMTDAERLIRSRAKLELARHVLVDDTQLLSSMEAAADEAFTQLRRRSNNLLQQGGWAITPTQF